MVTNIAGIFTVRPILTWMAGTASDVDMESLSFLIAIFSLTVVVPVLVSTTCLPLYSEAVVLICLFSKQKFCLCTVMH